MANSAEMVRELQQSLILLISSFFLVYKPSFEFWPWFVVCDYQRFWGSGKEIKQCLEILKNSQEWQWPMLKIF
jgi:hypothetical protein